MSKFRREDEWKEDQVAQQGAMAAQEEESNTGQEVNPRTVYIDMDHLRPNKRNEYKMTDIENLSAMIKLSGGILQNLIVRPDEEEGYYIITTGERRWRAARLLRDQGEYPEEFHNTVPCTVSDPEKINLPLDRDAKEDFSILVTNQYRDKTDGELFMEIQKWKKIIGRLRQAGVEYLPAGYNDGEGEELQIKGKKTRDIVAAQLGVSDRQVTRFEGVEKHASDELLDMLMADEMNLSAAETLSKLRQEEQEKIIKQLRKEKPDNLTKAVKEKVRKQEEKIAVQEEEVMSDMQMLIDLAAGKELLLTETAYKRYKRAVEQISQLLGGGRDED